MSEGRRTTKTQAVCLELGPLCSILGFPLPTQPSPPRRSHQGRLYRRGSGVLYIFYLQTAYFFGLEMCHKPILCLNVAQKCKTCSRLPEPQKFCFKQQRCSKVAQVFQPRTGQCEMSCVSSPHPDSPKRAAAPWGWGKGTDNISDYDLALLPSSIGASLKSRFHCTLLFSTTFVLKYDYEFLTCILKKMT